ncbi:MAG: helix-hairpin-helix domain-containing protein, partial [Corynebacterium flavescens]
LESLSGVGEVTAAAIIAHREEIGGFNSVEQLLDVSGIGPAKFEKLKNDVTP